MDSEIDFKNLRQNAQCFKCLYSNWHFVDWSIGVTDKWFHCALGLVEPNEPRMKDEEICFCLEVEDGDND